MATQPQDQRPGALWLRASSTRSVVRAHLRAVAGRFRAAGWQILEGEKPQDWLGPLAVLDEVWADPLPEVAGFLARRATDAPARWRVPRISGGVGVQDWPLRQGPYTTMDYERRAAAARLRPGAAQNPGSAPWLGFAVAGAADAQALLARGWPPEPESVLLEPGAVLYRYADPAGHERHELDPYIPDTAKIIVDVGCGHGRLGERHRGPGKIVVGIEPDPDLAQAARERLDQVLALDALVGLDTLEEPLDCVVFADVLEHLSDPESVLAKAAAMLAEDGRVIVSLPNSSWAPVLHAAAAGRWDLTLAGVQARDHLVPMTPESFSAMAGRCGLRVVERIPFPIPLTWKLRLWARLVAWSAGGRAEDLSAPQWVLVLTR